MDVQRFAVSGAGAGGRDGPVAFDVFIIAAAQRIRSVLLQQIEALFSESRGPLVAVDAGEFAQRIDGKALALDEL